MVDNRSRVGRSVLPEPGDDLMRIGTLKAKGKVAALEANLGSNALVNFEVDLVVIARSGKQPTEERVLAGTTTLFHMVYRSPKQGQFGVFKDTDPMPAQGAEPSGFAGALKITAAKLKSLRGAPVKPLAYPQRVKAFAQQTRAWLPAALEELETAEEVMRRG